MVVSDEQASDPTIYDKAIMDVDVDQWHNAMKLEIESMYSNEVWDLVDASAGIKPIRCKWVYKRKRG